ncbi:MAG: hypothetical protein MJ214_03505 [Bacilli bacterium]|nr:hypothetical protein [Bacilli bacterium]
MAKEIKKEKKDYQTLFLHVQELRLNEDKRIMDEKLKATQRVESHGSFFDKAKTTFKNTYNKVVSSAGNYDKKNKTIVEEVEKFNKDNTSIKESEANEQLKALIASDKTGIAQLMFDINVILDNKYKYTYFNDGLKLVSKYLHDKEDYLLDLKEDLEKTYKAVADKSLSLAQMGALAGVSLAAVLACIIVPFTTPAVAAGGAAVSTLFVGAALIGGTYIGMKEYNQEEVKKQFQKFTPDELAMHLSIQILCIKHLKKQLKEEEFKDRLNLILEELNTLKSDLDYYLFVEKQDIAKNKNKLHVFHGFDNCLEEALGL